MAPKLPPASLELEYIYGSSRKGCKGDIMKVNNRGHLVYPSAACAIVFDSQRNTQKIYREHTDDVQCIASHPNNQVFATGESGIGDGVIHVWNSNDLRTLATVNTSRWFKSGGVIAMAFSPDGALLAAVGGNPLDSQLLVFDWENGTLVASTRCSNRRTFYLDWNPIDNTIVWLGKGELKFFEVSNGAIRAQQGDLASLGDAQSFYDVVFNPVSGNSYVSTKEGNVYIFKANRMIGKKQLHNGAIYCLASSQDGFVSSGKDGLVKIWKFDMRPGVEFTQNGELNVGYAVDSCIAGPDSVVFTRGYYNNRLERFDPQSGRDELISLGHSAESNRTELWALDTVPNSNLFFSAGDDGRIMLWNKKSRYPVSSRRVPRTQFRGISVTPNGAQVAVSTMSGDVFVYNVQDFTGGEPDEQPNPQTSFRAGTEEIRVMRFSPDGTMLAVGSRNGKIYIYNVQNGYSKVTTLEGHTSCITALDWSTNQTYIQSTSGDSSYELLYWEVASASPVKQVTAMRNVEWFTQTCPLGWTVRGIWDMREYKNGTEINAVGVNFERNLIAYVDNSGDVNLCRYPTLSNNPPRSKFMGHCSRATNVAFSTDGEHLFTCGAEDLSIFQWKIVRNHEPLDEVPQTRQERRQALNESVKQMSDSTKNPQLGRSSVLFRTTAKEYGSKPVNQVSRHTTWRGIDGKFSKGFIGGMYRNNSLNTSQSRNRVLKDTGFSNMDNTL
uniref:Guanine nucleotide-binding protein subunit beta-like protein n=1 Tax=Percolomonas cosmopolitus TaxID=63605 RepID=A0A7S1PGI9_9EUKA